MRGACARAERARRCVHETRRALRATRRIMRKRPNVCTDPPAQVFLAHRAPLQPPCARSACAATAAYCCGCHGARRPRTCRLVEHLNHHRLPLRIPNDATARAAAGGWNAQVSFRVQRIASIHGFLSILGSEGVRAGGRTGGDDIGYGGAGMELLHEMESAQLRTLQVAPPRPPRPRRPPHRPRRPFRWPSYPRPGVKRGDTTRKYRRARAPLPSKGMELAAAV